MIFIFRGCSPLFSESWAPVLTQWYPSITWKAGWVQIKSSSIPAKWIIVFVFAFIFARHYTQRSARRRARNGGGGYGMFLTAFSFTRSISGLLSEIRHVRVSCTGIPYNSLQRACHRDYLQGYSQTKPGIPTQSGRTDRKLWADFIR